MPSDQKKNDDYWNYTTDPRIVARKKENTFIRQVKALCACLITAILIISFMLVVTLTRPAPTMAEQTKHMPVAQKAHASPTAQVPTPTPTPVFVQENVPTSTPQPTTPTPVTPIPTPQAPTPTPTPIAINNNPWGYNFTPGNLIYTPPSRFCNYFVCNSSFWFSTGYVVQCNDGKYSHSGGLSTACMYDGGKKAILYSH